MLNILSRAISFIVIILIGFSFKKVGLFKKEDFKVISKTVIYITLPCSIINNFASLDFDASLLILIVLGFVFTAILTCVGILVSKNKDIKEKQFNMLNISGYNIGCFTIPFAQSFLGPLSVVVICLIDAGNAILVCGGNYIWAKTLANDTEGENKLLFILKTLLKSPAVVCYFILIALQLLNINVPTSFLNLTTIIGSANTFLVMFMIGLGFELTLKKEHISKIANILFLRLLFSTIFSVLIYYTLPFNNEVKYAIIFAFFSPIGSLSSVYTEQLNCDVGLSSSVTSISILVSLFIMPILLILMN